MLRLQPSPLVFRLKEMGEAEFVAGMRAQRVLLGEIGNRNLRMVTHYSITAEDVRATVKAARSVLTKDM